VHCASRANQQAPRPSLGGMLSSASHYFFPATRTKNHRDHSFCRAPCPPQPFERQRRRKDQGRWGQRPSRNGCGPDVEWRFGLLAEQPQDWEGRCPQRPSIFFSRRANEESPGSLFRPVRRVRLNRSSVNAAEKIRDVGNNVPPATVAAPTLSALRVTCGTATGQSSAGCSATNRSRRESKS
jgi:hypothetical protein